MSDKPNPRDRFRAQEMANITIIRNYLDDAKSNYTTLDCPRAQIEQGAARYLHANNGHARLAFTSVVFDEVQKLVDKLSNASVMEMHMITLTPSKFAFSEKEARNFNPDLFQQHMDEWFGDFNTFGVIETGFYPRMKKGNGSEGGTVSYHAHCLEWGGNKRALQRAAERYKKDNDSFLPAMKSAYLSTLQVYDAQHVVGYSFKSPQNRYSVLNALIEKMDNTTGEFVEWLYQRQLKEAMRAGERVRMANVLANQYLDYLVVKSGAGRLLTDEILAIARRQYPEHEERLT